MRAAAEQGTRESGGGIRPRIGHKVRGQLRVSPGHSLAPETGQDCRSVRIDAFEQRPQQDSNLRTRLRRPLLYPLSYGGSDVARGREAVGPEPGYQSRTSEDTKPIGAHQCAGGDSLARVTHGLGRVMVVD